MEVQIEKALGKERIDRVTEVLIKWRKLPDCENRWSYAASTQREFPAFHLQEQVSVFYSFRGGEFIDRRTLSRRMYERRRGVTGKLTEVR